LQDGKGNFEHDRGIDFVVSRGGGWLVFD